MLIQDRHTLVACMLSLYGSILLIQGLPEQLAVFFRDLNFRNLN
jgi:hypothetical protein